MSADPEKTYALSIDPVTLVAGQTYGGAANPSLTLTIENTSPQPQELGSMNLTVPDGITITSAEASVGTASVVGAAPQVIELRTLALPQGGVMTVALGADVECTSSGGGYVWDSLAKQSNDFNGTGNDLTPSSDPLTNFVAGACRLVFTGQPANAVRSAVVTTEDFDPLGDPIEVTVATGDTSVVDGVLFGNPRTVTLSKETGPRDSVLGGTYSASTNGSGVATFAPTLDLSGSYTLRASDGVDVVDAISQLFVVVDSATACPATGPCSDTRSGPKTTATISSGFATGGFATISFNPPGHDDLCKSGTTGSDVVDANLTSVAVGGLKQVTIRIEKPYVAKAANKYQVCLRSLADFTAREGTGGTATVVVDDVTYYEGQLPDCSSSAGPAPCTLSRATVKGAVEVIYLLRLADDPPGKAM